LKDLVFSEIFGISWCNRALRPWMVSCLRQVVQCTHSVNIMGLMLL